MARPPLAFTSTQPIGLEIEEAHGVYLTDKDGKRYIDLISGISVNNLGHRNPQILDAIRQHLDRYLHTMVYGEFVQEKQWSLAKALTDHLPARLNSVYFTNSGSEAVEGALKLAKKATGRSQILAFNNAYHGSTHGALSVTGNDALKKGYGPLLPQVYHGVFNEAVSLELITRDTAAVIVEVIQGEAGVRVGTAGFLTGLRDKCTQTGTLLIVDEAQTGMGRTGTLFAFEAYACVPDILILAKALGGGMPLGAFISSQETMDVLSQNPALGHITTFGGHPLSCAAALAHLDILTSTKIIQEVAAKEALFRKFLIHERIREVRGKGLMLAVELGHATLREKVCRICLENGLLTDWFLFCDTALRVAPPLTITPAEIEASCTIINQALEMA